jgi:alkylated DNA repair dioxygenase AlkB
LTARAPQPDLFGGSPAASTLPEGFRYLPEAFDAAFETGLIEGLQELAFAPFRFHGHMGKRRVVSFGWRYGFGEGGLQRTEPIPGFLLPLRALVAGFAGVEPDRFVHVLVTEYAPGAGIGWHRDRPEFGLVAGVSLGSPCLFRFRLRTPQGFERASLTLAPRSAYVLDGSARTSWEHSIPEVDRLRYSLTFRTLRDG